MGLCSGLSIQLHARLSSGILYRYKVQETSPTSKSVATSHLIAITIRLIACLARLTVHLDSFLVYLAPVMS